MLFVLLVTIRGYTAKTISLKDWKQSMSRVNTAPSIKSIVDEMHQLSENEQRALAAAVLQDRKLEAFVEELEDHLACERATEEGPAKPFNLD
jgi:ABC-type transport system involved in cytochrome bd biosynthesis fused ATPase/permease subunit